MVVVVVASVWISVSFLNFLFFFAHFFSSKLIDSSRRDVERWQELLLVNVFECNIRFVARSRMTIDFNFIFVLLLWVFVLYEVGKKHTHTEERMKRNTSAVDWNRLMKRTLNLFYSWCAFFRSLDVMILLSTLPTFTTLNGVWSKERKFKRFLFRRQYDVVHLFVRMHARTHSHTQAAAAEQTQMMSNMFGPLKMELGSSWIKFESDKITTQMKHIDDGGGGGDNNKNTNRNSILSCDDTANFCGIIFSNFYFEKRKSRSNNE